MILEPPAKRLDEAPNTVEMPAPTAWPIVLAFGITLVFAGMVTTASVSILGAILALCGYAGWFRDVLPQEKQESVPVLEEPRMSSPAVPPSPGQTGSRTICTGHGFRSRSIRSRRVSKAAWPAALPWLFWQWHMD